MTASELNAMVSKWPEELRARVPMHWDAHTLVFFSEEETGTRTVVQPVALLAFQGAAVEWLAEHDRFVHRDGAPPNHWYISGLNRGASFTVDVVEGDYFAAIHAAVTATRTEGA